jgi:WD repeat-containing protein 19
MTDWAEIVTERLEITKSAGKITNLHWSKDGSIMTVTTGSGYFFGFLTVVPSLCSACDIHAALLSSLTEISIVDCGRNNMIVAKTNLDIEPAFLKLGPSHFAVGINNSIWYYKWRNPTLPENRM